MFLFWFDYLAADSLGALMCIEKVQRKPSFILNELTENVFKNKQMNCCNTAFSPNSDYARGF